MPEIIFDNGVLSNFSFSDSFNLLKKLYTKTSYVTNYVVAENSRGILKGYGELLRLKKALDEGWIKEIPLKTRKEKALFESLSISLGWGEASCIAVAKARDFTFACDDLAARKEAKLLEIPLTGTVGILLKATKKKFLDFENADALLKQMIDKGFYSPVKFLKELT